MTKQEIKRAEYVKNRVNLAKQVIAQGGDFTMLAGLYGASEGSAKSWLKYDMDRVHLYDAIDLNSGLRAVKEKEEKEAKAIQAQLRAVERKRVQRLAKTLNCSPAHAEKAIKRYSLANQA